MLDQTAPIRRGDIDGLRAVAILAVAAFHAFPDSLPGGYAGVDVFFVISGYLITRLLTREAAAGRLGYGGFLLRRLRRLAPAFLLVASATTMLAWAALPPDRLLEYLHALGASLALGSNWYFFATTNYFNDATAGNFLLHTWSLGVEEQFYLFFPLLGFVLAKRRFLLDVAVLLLLAASLGAAWYETTESGAGGAFYATHLRAWELLSGAALARCEAAGALKRLQGALGPLTAQAGLALFALGLAAILAACLFYNAEARFPGPAALLPISGGLACLAAGALAPGAGARVGLDLAPLRWLGRVSYAWYLWHWPALVGLRLIDQNPSDTELGLALVISLLLAAITHHVFERPIHRSLVLRTTGRLAAGVGLAGAGLATAVGYGIVSDGAPERIPASVAAILAVRPDDRDADRPCGDAATLAQRLSLPAPSAADSGLQLCLLGAWEADRVPDFLLWGDSHAAALSSALSLEARRRGLKGIAAVRGACPPTLGGGWSALPPQELAACVRFNDQVARLIARWRPAHTLLVGHWDIYAPRHNGRPGKYRSAPSALQPAAVPFLEGLEASLAYIAGASRAMLLLDVPTHDFDVPHALATAQLLPLLPSPSWLGRTEHERNRASYAPRMQAWAQEGLVRLVDPMPAFCPKGACLATIGGTPAFLDASHLSAAGADFLLAASPQLLPAPAAPPS